MQGGGNHQVERHLNEAIGPFRLTDLAVVVHLSGADFLRRAGRATATLASHGYQTAAAALIREGRHPCHGPAPTLAGQLRVAPAIAVVHHQPFGGHTPVAGQRSET